MLQSTGLRGAGRRDPTAAAARTGSEPRGASEEPRRPGGFVLVLRAEEAGRRRLPTARLVPEDKGENRSY